MSSNRCRMKTVGSAKIQKGGLDLTTKFSGINLECGDENSHIKHKPVSTKPKNPMSLKLNELSKSRDNSRRGSSLLNRKDNQSNVSKSWDFNRGSQSRANSDSSRSTDLNRRSLDLFSIKKSAAVSQFDISLGFNDDAVSTETATSSFNMRQMLRIERIEGLEEIYQVGNYVLQTHATQYYADVELSKRQATEEWLKSRSKEEQEQYLKRHGNFVQVSAWS